MCKFFTALCFLCAAASTVLALTPEFDKNIQRELTIIDAVHNFDFNPHTASYASEAQILNSIYEGLFSYHPYTLEAEPALAESFKISRDKKTWTFNIRKDAVFSNGDPITAESVRLSWLALIDPTLNAPFASLLDCIEGVENYRTGKAKNPSAVGITASDAKTLVVKLRTPTEHLNKILCHHAFSVLSKKTDAYSGAFTLDSATTEKITLKKNNRYWDAESVALPSVVITLSDDSKSNTYLFNIGKADWVSATIDIQQVFNTAALKLSPQFGTEYLFFKVNEAPFNNADFRNALLYAVPFEQLRKNSLINAYSLILRLPGYPKVEGIEEQDMKTAKEYLLKSGVVPQSVTVQICVPDQEGSNERADLLVKAWEELGIKVAIEKSPIQNYIQNITTSNAQVFNYVWIGDFADPTAFLELFKGNSGLNESGWKNQRYDSLLNEAAQITDTTKRYEKLAEAEQLLLDSGMIIPVSHTVSLNIIDTASVAGWYDNALDVHPYKYLYFIENTSADNLVKSPGRFDQNGVGVLYWVHEQ